MDPVIAYVTTPALAERGIKASAGYFRGRLIHGFHRGNDCVTVDFTHESLASKLDEKRKWAKADSFHAADVAILEDVIASGWVAQ